MSPLGRNRCTISTRRTPNRLRRGVRAGIRRQAGQRLTGPPMLLKMDALNGKLEGSYLAVVSGGFSMWRHFCFFAFFEGWTSLIFSHWKSRRRDLNAVIMETCTELESYEDCVLTPDANFGPTVVYSSYMMLFYTHSPRYSHLEQAQWYGYTNRGHSETPQRGHVSP